MKGLNDMEAHVLIATIETCKQNEYCKTCSMRGTITCRQIKEIYGVKKPKDLKVLNNRRA